MFQLDNLPLGYNHQAPLKSNFCLPLPSSSRNLLGREGKKLCQTGNWQNFHGLWKMSQNALNPMRNYQINNTCGGRFLGKQKTSEKNLPCPLMLGAAIQAKSSCQKKNRP